MEACKRKALIAPEGVSQARVPVGQREVERTSSRTAKQTDVGQAGHAGQEICRAKPRSPD